MSDTKPLGDYIDGRFLKRRHADGQLISSDPCNREHVIGEFPLYDEAASEAIAAARATFGEWSMTPLPERLTVMRKLRAQLQNRGEDLAHLTAIETGRPLWETRGDVAAMRQQLDAVVRHGLAEIELQGPPPMRAEVSFRPRGVVAVITPCSQAALLMHLDVVSALAVGCTVVCKPSPQAPAVAQLYAELMHEADLPGGAFNLVQGDDDCGQRIAEDPEVDALLFAGSHENARKLRDAVTEHTERSPLLRLHSSAFAGALVLDDANLDLAASSIVIGACASNGLRCSNTHVVLAHQRIAARLKDRLQATLSRVNIGPSTASDTFLGPLPHDSYVVRFENDIRRLRELGAEELLYGGRHEQRYEEGPYVTPALFGTTTAKLPALMRQELCGPMLVLATVDDPEQGAELLSHPHRQLCHAIFTHDPDALAIARGALPGCALLLNQPTTRWLGDLPLEPRQPLGGTLAGGSLTARALVQPTVLVESDGAFDPTALPPGIPRPL